MAAQETQSTGRSRIERERRALDPASPRLPQRTAQQPRARKAPRSSNNHGPQKQLREDCPSGKQGPASGAILQTPPPQRPDKRTPNAPLPAALQTAPTRSARSSTRHPAKAAI